jgi:5'(3')-deoxyribonucleotidase
MFVNGQKKIREWQKGECNKKLLSQFNIYIIWEKSDVRLTSKNKRQWGQERKRVWEMAKEPALPNKYLGLRVHN